MQEIIDLLTENPERTAAMAYTGTAATGMAYVGYKNDFGASGMTDIELNDYLEDNSSSLNPVKIYKKHVFSNELDKREEDNLM